MYTPKTVGSRIMLGPHGFGSKVELQQQVEAKLERWRSGEVESQAKVEKEERCSFQLPQGSCTVIIFLSTSTNHFEFVVQQNQRQ